jgi:lysophospholipase L1-like esterase
MKNNMRLLFQGDSITDAGRARDPDKANVGLGTGYASMVASDLLAEFPENNLEVMNRGISGNRIVDAYARWKSDAINLKPDVISILLGVNDTWHEKGSQNGVELARYREVFDMLLSYTKEKCPDVQLILCQPFVLPVGAVDESWIPEIKERGEMVHELAKMYDATYVPFQSVFDNALKRAPAEYWLGDGVHPTLAGHRLMANLWKSVVNL